MQLSLDKHEFELQGSTDRQIFFKSYIRKFVEDLQQSENSQTNCVDYRYRKKLRKNYVMNSYMYIILYFIIYLLP